MYLDVLKHFGATRSIGFRDDVFVVKVYIETRLDKNHFVRHLGPTDSCVHRVWGFKAGEGQMGRAL